MKIGFFGLSLEEGKFRYEDPMLKQLELKCKPKKVSPYYAQFVRDEATTVDAIVTSKESLLDILIVDMEKCEMRISRTESEPEKALMNKCLKWLEGEKPLCDIELNSDERELLMSVQMVSMKPVLVFGDSVPQSEMIRDAFDAIGMVFFYTAGPDDVHAWDIRKGSELVECAGKIHSDLARGFIKADLVTIEDFLSSHSFNDCKKLGLAKVVDRDYPISPGQVIEIRFNV